MKCEHKWGPTIYSYRFDESKDRICYCFKCENGKNQQTRFCVDCGQVEHFCDNIWSVSYSRFDQNKISQVLTESLVVNEVI